MQEIDQKGVFLRKIIREIGDFQIKNFKKDILFEEKSGPQDLVSFVDKESESLFQEAVKREFPDDVVMGEESYDKQRDYRTCKKIWVIDPLDGTLMYSRGIPHFGPMIAYLEDGEIKLSAILLPMSNDLYEANEGGAYKNGEAISVSRRSNLKDFLIQAPTKGLMKRLNWEGERIKNLLENVGRIMENYAMAFRISSIADGKFDAGISLSGGPWDTIPGGFLVEKAGGRVSNVGSHEWDIWNPKIVFSNKTAHEELLKLID